jgi:hypothetical protein
VTHAPVSFCVASFSNKVLMTTGRFRETNASEPSTFERQA